MLNIFSLLREVVIVLWTMVEGFILNTRVEEHGAVAPLGCCFFCFPSIALSVHNLVSDMLVRSRPALIVIQCKSVLSNGNLHDKNDHKGFLKTKL